MTKIESFTDAVQEVLRQKFNDVVDTLRAKHSSNFLAELDSEISKISAETYFVVTENLPNKVDDGISLVINFKKEISK